MSLEKIHLRKLLFLINLSPQKQRSYLRKMVRENQRKAAGLSAGGGGDFHTPFWSDAKDHAFGESDLEESTDARIENNRTHRARLYPLLKQGFLKWLHEQQRGRNKPFERANLTLPRQYKEAATGCTIKIDKILALYTGDGYRIAYPYFDEDPVLTDEVARIGLWVMISAYKQYGDQCFEILDVLRANGFNVRNNPLVGNEQALFHERYAHLVNVYRQIEKELSS